MARVVIVVVFTGWLSDEDLLSEKLFELVPVVLTGTVEVKVTVELQTLVSLVEIGEVMDSPLELVPVL